MKFRSIYLWIFLCVLALSSIITALQYRNFEPRNEVLVFVTLGLDQSKVPGENSSYEIQRASEHFSDLLLGWTLEPYFREKYINEAGEWHTLRGQRQEKQNLLFTITNLKENIKVNDLSSGEAFLKVLEQQLLEYNTATNQAYVLAIKNISYKDGEFSAIPLFGQILLIMILLGASLFVFEYASTRRRS